MTVYQEMRIDFHKIYRFVRGETETISEMTTEWGKKWSAKIQIDTTKKFAVFLDMNEDYHKSVIENLTTEEDKPIPEQV